MYWIPILIVAAVVTVFVLLKKTSQISAAAALAHLKNGALVIDVRSAGEFKSGHLPKAINIPLNELEVAVSQMIKDKYQVLLLHCLSGTRSGIARKKLKEIGYSNVFNLGSYGRAENILKQQQ
jgi:phage shock protein E